MSSRPYKGWLALGIVTTAAVVPLSGGDRASAAFLV